MVAKCYVYRWGVFGPLRWTAQSLKTLEGGQFFSLDAGRQRANVAVEAEVWEVLGRLGEMLPDPNGHATRRKNKERLPEVPGTFERYLDKVRAATFLPFGLLRFLGGI